MRTALGLLLIVAVSAGGQGWRKRNSPNPPPAAIEVDLCVYGGTSAGVVAAVQMRRLGGTAVIIEPGRHLGGLTAGGLGATDTGKRGAIGGLSREFYRQVRAHYETTYGADSVQLRDCSDGFRFEPRVAEMIFDRWVVDHDVPVFFDQYLADVTMVGERITQLTTDRGLRVRARHFVDCTYEGDLLAAAGVSFHVGREANSVYGETINGVQLHRPTHNFKVPVDPYLAPELPEYGLLPGVSPEPPGETGQGDDKVQAYNFRMCLTRDRTNQIPFPRPEGYDPLRYELLARYLRAGVWDVLDSAIPMPNGKTDTNNNGAFSTDNIGLNYAWPTGDRATREAIYREHITYQQGLLWFLAHDERVPEAVRAEVNEWGLCGDEFVETGGWSHQIYVREGRRMVADVVMTEHHCRSAEVVDDSVGLASYNMDSHNTQRVVWEGRALNEGDVQVGCPRPYPISYRAIVPRRGEATNLLVPVCLSSSHIAYGSMRMEPVFMVLGQSAATAAWLADRERARLQDLDYATLAARLAADGQILAWSNDLAGVPEIKPSSLPGIVLDDTDARLTGDWTPSANLDQRRVGIGYVHDGNQNKGASSVIFTPKLPKAGRYEVRIPYAEHANRATNVPIRIETTGRQPVVWRLNQRVAAPEGWASLGVVELGLETTVTIANEGTDGFVVVDGIQFLPAD